jgi:hypothetical protein
VQVANNILLEALLISLRGGFRAAPPVCPRPALDLAASLFAWFPLDADYFIWQARYVIIERRK